MNYNNTRIIAKYAHVAAGLFNVVYAYSSLHYWKHAITIVQWLSFPVLIISGIWLTKGYKIWSKFIDQNT